MIKVDNVYMDFRIANDKVMSLKEYFIAMVEKRIRYEKFHVLQNISFEVKRGETFGIIGKNGAGKSTLLKIIAGVLLPISGSVKVDGNIVPMLELGAGFDMELNGSENIYLNGAMLGYSEDFLNSKYDEIVSFSELEAFIDTPLRNYSSGMLMRLAFSIATIVKPEVLIVDEILSVGDEGFQNKSKKRMMELMGGGATVLFVSHSIDQIQSICNRVLWLEEGKIKKLGNAEEVCQAYKQSWV